jgi:hypothetical protein
MSASLRINRRVVDPFPINPYYLCLPLANGVVDSVTPVVLFDVRNDTSIRSQSPSVTKLGLIK